MKNQKGSAAIWILVIVIIIAAGAAYWYWIQGSSQPTTTATTELPTQQNTVRTPAQNSNPNSQGQTTSNPAAQTTSTQTSPAFSATPTSGKAPLTVTFNGVLSTSNPSAFGGLGVDEPYITFGGDEQSGNPVFCANTPSDVTNYVYPTSCTFPATSHTYTSPGTYTAVLHLGEQKGIQTVLGTVTITVTSQNAPTQNNAPSATIDQGSLISSTTPKLSGSVSGTSQIIVAVWPGNLTPSQMVSSASNMPFWGGNTEIRDPEVYVSNGRWYTSIGNSEVAGLGGPIPYFPNGTYTVSVADANTGKILTSDTLEITGPSINVTNATASTVTFSYADLPGNSQVLLAGQSNNPPTVATVSGSGSGSISIPGGLQGTYWLQVELNGNASNILQSGPFSANWVGR